MIAGIVGLSAWLPAWAAAMIVATVVLAIAVVVGAVGWKKRVTRPLARIEEDPPGRRSMGEKAPDVSTEPSPQVLEHEVEVIRDNVTQIAQELDQRRRDLFDWRYQFVQHATMTLLVGAAALFHVRRGRRFRQVAHHRESRAP